MMKPYFKVLSIKQAWSLILITGLLVSQIVACSNDSEDLQEEQSIFFEKQIVGFDFSDTEMASSAIINHDNKTIEAFVYGGVDITQLTPVFELSPDATIFPAGGKAYDFTGGKVFQVVAPDKSFTNYTITVTTVNNSINAFKLITGQESWALGIREGVITKVAENSYEVNVTIHHDDELTSLGTIVDVYDGTLISPDPSSVKDYSSPVVFTAADDKNNGSVRSYKVVVTQKEEKATQWTKDGEFDNDDGIQLYTSTTSFRYNADGSEMSFSAYAVTIDMNKGYRFVPYYNKDKGNMTVKQMVDGYEIVHGTMPLIGINSGYFSSTSSYSLIIKDSEVLSNNIAQLSRDGSFYVTRGAFSQDADNNFSADWVYTIDGGTVYGYPNPSPNVDGQTPQPKPSESFPANGFAYDRVNAIGGGPLLIREGNLVDDFGYELFYDDIIRSIANRTAIGVTANNELVILVVNGRASYSEGITLRDMANLLKNDFGCMHALNLDGGGSSTLVLNGNLFNQNSIDVGQRSVLTGLLIVK
jgi:exopolysaccharide biosynthesis protein